MPAPSTPPVDRLEHAVALDAPARALEGLAGALPDDARGFLSGAWLGHPLHPALTDLPIGFWTSAWTLDIVGGRRCAPAATVLVGLGVLSAVPTAAAGMVDFTEMSAAKKRVGIVHAASNIAATAAYAASFVARCRGRRARGIAWGFLGAGVATVGGYLGGHLVFGGEGDAAQEGDTIELYDTAPGGIRRAQGRVG
jgi:uncharacterized membrane protein